MDKDYYQILGVEKNATTEQIREAYREIARVYHPDSNFYDEIIKDAMPAASMDKFKLITAAYNTLVNEEKRALYNETLPPELNGWDDDQQPGSDHQDWVRRKTRTSGVYAMGQFGNLKKSPDQDPIEPKETIIMTVDEMIAIQEQGWHKKLWHLIRNKLFSSVRSSAHYR